MMKRSILIASIFAALLATGCKQETAAPEPVRPVLSILVEPARSSDTAAAGTVEPRFKSELGFRVLVKQTGIKYGAVEKAMATIRATPATLTYKLKARGDETNIAWFGGVQRRKGVSYRLQIRVT